MPETQRWLAKKGRIDECKRVLEIVYENKSVLSELDYITNEIKHDIELTEC